MEQSEPFSPSVRNVLRSVRERIGLDFFGVDFAITPGGDVVLFEANATMGVFPFSTDPQFACLRRVFAPAQQAFRKLLGRAPAEL